MLKIIKGDYKKMKTKILIDIIIDFCFEYELFNQVDNIDEVKNVIEQQLEDSAFIENLINIIILKTKNHKYVDTEKTIKLLTELEKLRLEIEYENINKLQTKS